MALTSKTLVTTGLVDPWGITLDLAVGNQMYWTDVKKRIRFNALTSTAQTLKTLSRLDWILPIGIALDIKGEQDVLGRPGHE